MLHEDSCTSEKSHMTHNSLQILPNKCNINIYRSYSKIPSLVVKYFHTVALNPICTGLFWCIRYWGGGTLCPPLNIFGLGRVRVPILFGNYFPRSDLPYTKGFMKFGCPEPSKKVFDFWNFCLSKWCLTRFVRVPPYEILLFPTNFIFSAKRDDSTG